MGTMSYFSISKCMAGTVRFAQDKTVCADRPGIFLCSWNSIVFKKQEDIQIKPALQESWPRLDHIYLVGSLAKWLASLEDWFPLQWNGGNNSTPLIGLLWWRLNELAHIKCLALSLAQSHPWQRVVTIIINSGFKVCTSHANQNLSIPIYILIKK